MKAPNKRAYPRVHAKRSHYTSFLGGGGGIRNVSVGVAPAREMAIAFTNLAPITKAEAATPGHQKRPISLRALLVGSGIIAPAQLALATTHTERPGGQLPQVLVRFGVISEDDLASLLAEEYRLAVIDLTSIDPTSDVLRLVPHALARRHVILPIGLAGSTLSVAIADPTNLVGLSEVKLRSGYGLNVALAPAESLSTAIERFYVREPLL